MSKPNLFSFATKELSQDAMICWLLSWAHPDYKNSDKDLHECAISMIQEMFEKCSMSCPRSIKNITLVQQEKNIDVLCRLEGDDGKYIIIIEDKTNTKNHGTQLTDYYEYVRVEVCPNEQIPEKNILRIYFKTGDQSDYSEVCKAGYKKFLRPEILSVLEKYKDKHSILDDYCSHLRAIEKEVNSLTDQEKEYLKEHESQLTEGQKEAYSSILGEQAQEGNHEENAGEKQGRSEERRVGKECRSRWSPYH